MKIFFHAGRQLRGPKKFRQRLHATCDKTAGKRLRAPPFGSPIPGRPLFRRTKKQANPRKPKPSLPRAGQGKQAENGWANKRVGGRLRGCAHKPATRHALQDAWFPAAHRSDFFLKKVRFNFFALNFFLKFFFAQCVTVRQIHARAMDGVTLSTRVFLRAMCAGVTH